MALVRQRIYDNDEWKNIDYYCNNLNGKELTLNSDNTISVGNDAIIPSINEDLINFGDNTVYANYDCIVLTQNDFDNLLDDRYAENILIVGDGGTLTFTNNGSWILNSNIRKITGINNAILNITTTSSTDAAILGAITNQPILIENITLNTNNIGFKNFSNLNNCKVNGSLSIGFDNCGKKPSETNNINHLFGLNNCYSNSNVCFNNCDNLFNCVALPNSSSGNNRCAYRNCNKLENCSYVNSQNSQSLILIGFDLCNDLINCCYDHSIVVDGGRSKAGSSIVFKDCIRLTNCEAYAYSYSSPCYAFSGCSYLTNCYGENEMESGTGSYTFYNTSYCSCCSGLLGSITWGGTTTKRSDASCMF